MNMCLRLRPTTQPFPFPFHSLPTPTSLPLALPFRRHRSLSAAAMSSSPPQQQIVEHVVLFKVKPSADPSAMLSGLNSLSSLDQVLHLSAGTLLRSRCPPPLSFTHLLHSRYASKADLAAYSNHPDHLAVVKQSVLPICDDIMAVDWLADGLAGDSALSPPLGSALRLSFLKLREGLGEEAKSEVFAAIEGVKEGFAQISQLSVGENFSPARAKGFSIASLAVFPGVSELEAVDSDKEALESHKGKVRDYLESVIVVDYVVSSLTQSASL